MSAIDLTKSRRESTRWLILLTLNAARPLGAGENLLRTTIAQEITDITAHEIRRELDYLTARELAIWHHSDLPHWRAELTRIGIDVAEYTVDCDPGIARPAKYWGD
jgi:hypothetical protein